MLVAYCMWGSEGEKVGNESSHVPARLPVLNPDSHFPRESVASSKKPIQVLNPTSLQRCFNASFSPWQKLGLSVGSFPPSSFYQSAHHWTTSPKIGCCVECLKFKAKGSIFFLASTKSTKEGPRWHCSEATGHKHVVQSRKGLLHTYGVNCSLNSACSITLCPSIVSQRYLSLDDLVDVPR
jgi:hypothetical protein